MTNPPSAVALLHFQEPAGVQPRDALGNLTDLTVETGLVMPAVEEAAWTGRGRRFSFGLNNGLVAEDASDLGTLLKQDATVQAILSIDTDSSLIHTIYARGTNVGTLADRTSLGLQVWVRTDGNYEARLFHSDNNGTLLYLPPGVFQPPADGALFLLTATRSFRSVDEVVARYYLGETMIAEVEFWGGSIAGGVIARTSIGVRGNAGAWTDYFNGVLDELAVYNYEMSPGEVRSTWRRLTQHQPAGVDMFTGLMPPGVPWFDNPGNEIGKRVKAVGQSLGMKIAAAEELKDIWLPGSPAPLAIIDRHEALAGVVPGRLDSLDQRNARLLKHAQSDTDFSHATIFDLFAESFGQNGADLEIIELGNTFEPVLDSSAGAALDPEQWLVDGPGSCVVTNINRLVLSTPNASDGRYAAERLWQNARMPIDVGRFGLNDGKPGRFYAQTKIDDYTTLAQGTGVGMLLASLGRNEHVWFGVYRHTVAEGAPNTWDLYMRVLESDGTYTEQVVAFAPAAAFGAAVAVWLRVMPRIGNPGFITLDEIPLTLWASITGPNTGYVAVANLAPRIGNMEWAGWSMLSTIVLPTPSSAMVSGLKVKAPDSLRTYNWYVYRDGFDFGAVNPIPAQRLFAREKPAHTTGNACQSKSVLYDDPFLGTYDCGPMGGY